MEYGPRALGHRSILASPLSKEMKDVVNDRIKHRESFRPFAGAVPLEQARNFFEIEGGSPYMQFVVPVKQSALNRDPARRSFWHLQGTNCRDGKRPDFS